MSVAIKLVDVQKCYGRREVLSDVSLDVTAGSKLGLIGPAASAGLPGSTWPTPRG